MRTRVAAFAVAPAREWLKPLTKSGEPEGNYRIALGIDKVWFEDGTIWELEPQKTIAQLGHTR